jgi:hypothetical protein
MQSDVTVGLAKENFWLTFTLLNKIQSECIYFHKKLATLVELYFPDPKRGQNTTAMKENQKNMFFKF